MKLNLLSFLSGLIFSLGLGIGGMSQTQKVQGFLDIFGNWDPTLLFVMGGAVSVHFLVIRLSRNRTSAPRTGITPALIFGALLFGMGWALAGYCPGPAVVALATLQPRAIVFVMSMLMGMFLSLATLPSRQS